MEKPAVFNRKDMLTVAQVTKLIPGLNGGPCSRQHIYNLIDNGELSPAFKFGKNKGIFVPRPVVERYISGCLIDVGS